MLSDCCNDPVRRGWIKVEGWYFQDLGVDRLYWIEKRRGSKMTCELLTHANGSWKSIIDI
jgi:hypothetical protein